MYKYKVIATIKEIRGEGSCPYGHKVGDVFEFGSYTPAGLCHFAYESLHSAVAVTLYGGKFPWAREGQPTTWGCPDPDRTVVFELARVPRDQG